VERFRFTGTDDRLALNPEDEFRDTGESHSLSCKILGWLQGGEEKLTLPASDFEYLAL
jgi:hypothetical protein